MKIIKSILVLAIFVPLLVFAQNPGELPRAGLTPESRFYFFDKLGEALRVFFTFNPEAKIKLHMAHAAERVAEIKVILETKGVGAKGLEIAKVRLEDSAAKAKAIAERQKQKDKQESKLTREIADTFELDREQVREAVERASKEKEQKPPEPQKSQKETVKKSEEKQQESENIIHQEQTRTPEKAGQAAEERVEQKPATTSVNSRFTALEKELTEAKTSGLFLSPEHYERIEKDLNALQNEGYGAEEISRLRQIAKDLAPHLKDKEQTPVAKAPASVCTSNSAPQLVSDITDFSKIQKITAPGSPSSEGPKGHSFIGTEHQRVPVYVPVEAVLESGAYYTGGDGATQYILTFKIKNICDFVFKFDHIDEPVDRIRNVFPFVPRPTEDTRGEAPSATVSFNAGELVGYTTGTRQAGNWDFGLYDMSKEGALATAGSYGMHRHAVCWVDYYSAEKQAQYRGLLEGPKLVCAF